MQLGYTVRILFGARATSIDGKICLCVYIYFTYRDMLISIQYKLLIIAVYIYIRTYFKVDIG